MKRLVASKVDVAAGKSVTLKIAVKNGQVVLEYAADASRSGRQVT